MYIYRSKQDTALSSTQHTTPREKYFKIYDPLHYPQPYKNILNTRICIHYNILANNLIVRLLSNKQDLIYIENFKCSISSILKTPSKHCLRTHASTTTAVECTWIMRYTCLINRHDYESAGKYWEVCVNYLL